MSSGDLVQEAWDEHAAWSNVATRLKDRRTLWRRIVLALTIAGAALQTVAGTTASERLRFGTGLAGTIALTLVALFARQFLTPDRTKSWLRARSISEGIKSEVYAFRATATPYEAGDERVLVAAVRTIRDWGTGLEVLRAGTAPPRREAPPPLSPDDYIARRLREQIDNYYRPKAAENARAAERARNIEFLLALAAAILGAYATFTKSAGAAPWVAVLTTIGGTLAAYAAASRYEFQATTFYATARQLSDLTADWRTSKKLAPSPEWSQFVRACEEVISAENRGWMAKLDETKAD